ncbi:MAG: TetR/AcrR family transcriptional regulator [Hyphomicrobiaceae bacterium]|nr:TetR/AcrR family transcriptional regulator [Hyphomicrobiaceae bacterium]
MGCQCSCRASYTQDQHNRSGLRRNIMGRRSAHTPDQLRELIIAAATELIVERGLSGLSAREIARKVNYSPGTIYNVFRDLDDLIFTIESRMLDDLAAKISALPPHADVSKRLTSLAQLYLRFSLQKPQLWNLLMEHVPASRDALPADFKARIKGVVAAVERIVQPLAGHDEDRTRRATAVLWSGLHGISTLATANKLSHVTDDDAFSLVTDFVTTFVAGLNAGGADSETVAVAKQKKRAGAKL